MTMRPLRKPCPECGKEKGAPPPGFQHRMYCDDCTALHNGSPRQKLTQASLRRVLSYDADTGIFRRAASSGTAHVGDIAGGIAPNGYWQISVLGMRCRAHQLAWLWVVGEWPAGEIDHINGVRSDNRWENLRLVTVGGNAQNKCGKLGASGLRGVRFHKQNRNWVAAIKINRKAIHLGSFATPEEAHEAYLKAKAENHPHANIDRLRGERRRSSEGASQAVLAIAPVTKELAA